MYCTAIFSDQTPQGVLVPSFPGANMEAFNGVAQLIGVKLWLAGQIWPAVAHEANTKSLLVLLVRTCTNNSTNHRMLCHYFVFCYKLEINFFKILKYNNLL